MIRESEYKGQCTLSVRLRLEHGRFLTLEDATDALSRNVGKEYYYSLRNSAEERSSHLLVTFPRQQWLRERGLMLRYTFIAYVQLYHSGQLTGIDGGSVEKRPNLPDSTAAFTTYCFT